MGSECDRAITVTYTNFRNETTQRHIIPQYLHYGSTSYHPEPQMLLTAYDVDRMGVRTFAVKDMVLPPNTKLEVKS